MGKYSDFSLEHFSNSLRYIREERHMAQGDLARATGLNQASISAYERGTRDPKLSVYCTLADALRIDPIEFFINDATAEVLRANDNIIMLAQSSDGTYSSNRDKEITNLSRQLRNLGDEEFDALTVVIKAMLKGAELSKDYRKGPHD